MRRIMVTLGRSVMLRYPRKAARPEYDGTRNISGVGQRLALYV